MIFPKRGLYAITQTENKTDTQILNDVEQIILGGAVVLQYRDKRENKTQDLAEQLLTLCQQHNIPLIINDDIKLAQAIHADGVHLGKDDGSVLEARQVLGEHKIIGVSCYNNLNLALQAQQQGANYVAFGRFFSSSTKPLASPADIQTLIQAKQVLTVPIVAIGGILPNNATSLLNAGADLLAVIGGLYTEQPKKSAQDYSKLFNLGAT